MVDTAAGSFAELLKEHRAAAGLTQEELAERAQLSARTISDLERGVKQRPYSHTVQRLVTALGLGEEAAGRFRAASRQGEPASEQAQESTRPGYQWRSLTPQPTPFIGRRMEVETVKELLGRREVRLLTLTGPAGVGKTRLALRVAEEAADGFPDGASFAALAPLTDPALVPSSIAASLGIMDASDQPVTESLVAHLREKQPILVLDNFEHLLPAATILSSILTRCPRLKVLVTSRAVLHLAAEHEYAVPLLPVPTPGHLPDLNALSRYDAIRLFLQRAQAVKPDFHLNEQNAASIAAICSRLDGLPLAIELAAARVRLFPPQIVLDQLSHRLRFLTGGPVDVPAKHQTLRGAIEWSYSLLEPEQQALFARLSVFAGDWTFEAAEAVCNPDGASDVLAEMTALLEQSLILQEGGAEPRFRMLQTLRDFAAERLHECGEERRYRAAHARYYIQLAEAADPELKGPRQAEWLARLETELPNIRVARAELRNHGSAEHELRLALGLYRFWGWQGYWSEARGWLEEALARDEEVESRVRGTALLVLGSLIEWQGGHEAAISRLHEALAILESIGDTAARIGVLNMLGNVRASQGKHREAISWYEQTAALSAEVGNELGSAMALHNAGMVAFDLGDAATALKQVTESGTVYRKLGDTCNVVLGLGVQGMALVALGDLTMAQARFDEGLNLAREVGDKSGTNTSLWGLGMVAVEQGSLDQARQLLREPLIACWELGNKEFTLYILGTWAKLILAEGSSQRVGTLLAAIAALRQSFGMPMVPREQVEHDHLVELAQAGCGQDAWSQAWEEGRAMSLDEAVKFALGGQAGSETDASNRLRIHGLPPDTQA